MAPEPGVFGAVVPIEAADRVGLDVVDDQRGAAGCLQDGLGVAERAVVEGDA
jgi:hypothetical protein